MSEPTNGDSSSMALNITPQRARMLQENLKAVTSRINAANTSNRNIRLILVSKLHPANSILSLHQSPTAPSHFGENYAQELQAKAAILPTSIKWHMIGGLQTNKCKPLAEGVRNLWCVSSVDSAKKADELEKGRRNLAQKENDNDGGDGEKLRVQVQVNTSGEEAKSGVEPADAAALCRHIRESCVHLQLAGLMTIGAIARSQASEQTDNEDFVCLRETRDKVVKELGLNEGELELSMGMSADFEEAIKQGSGEVRVGSTVFGERPARGDAVVVEEEGGGVK